MKPYKEALGVPGDVLIFAERGNSEDKHFQTLQLSLSCIFIALQLYLKKSCEIYLRMLNVFDCHLRLMQTDNYIYFLLIDVYSVFLMNIKGSITDKPVLTRKLCNSSLVCNLSLWYLYSLSYLYWLSWSNKQEKQHSDAQINLFSLFYS